MPPDPDAHSLAAAASSGYADKQRDLIQMLRLGLAVVTELWSFGARDWVTSVHAADIDNDGDIEIVLGSRDGHVYALTMWGHKKWKTRLGEGHWVSSVIGVARAGPSSNSASLPVGVIAGSRDGKVYALDQEGQPITSWTYDTGQVVRQVYINPAQPERVIVGSEDRGVHVLLTQTGEFCWRGQTNGWIRSVFSYDIDGDGQPEILAASGDKRLYVFNSQGELLRRPFSGKFYPGHKPRGHKISSLAILPASLESGKATPAELLATSDGKDLYALTTLHRGRELSLKRAWLKTTRDGIFENRLHAIYAADLNQDGEAEIIAGSEDKHLYLLDRHGRLLWKHDLGSCVWSVFALDFDHDGTIEIIVGLEDHSVRALRVELPKEPLLQRLQETYNHLLYPSQTAPRRPSRGLPPSSAEEFQPPPITSFFDRLSPAEHALLQDLIQTEANPQPFAEELMELSEVEADIRKRFYLNALSKILRLRQRKVQHYWRTKKNEDLGYIRVLCFGDVAGNGFDEIIVGTDEGRICAFDIEHGRELWSVPLEERVWMIQMGRQEDQHFETILASLANRRVYKLSHQGQILGAPLQQDDWIWSIHINRAADRSFNEVILGSENRCIYIYDANLEPLSKIETPQGIRILCTCDIDGDGELEIIAGAMDDQVYAYKRDGRSLWNFKTQDRVRALCAADLDHDGRIEVIVGSEDRNVYVLDSEGLLKWRYYTPHRVLDVDALDLDHDGQLEVLLGVADGYLYVLSSEGDLRWKFKAADRIRAVRAKDVNQDGQVEIAVGSEDQLYLLQVLDQQQLDDLTSEAWLGFLNTEYYDRTKEGLYYLLSHADRYLRAFALSRLAVWPESLTEADFEQFERALNHDKSLVIRKALPEIFATLLQSQQRSTRVRRFFQRLATDPQREVRLAFVEILASLVAVDEALCFEYLDRLRLNVDTWVRRSVVRQLDRLLVSHPERAFRVLLTLTRDQEEWICQEAGRSLARYFDLHPTRLASGTNLLLDPQQRTRFAVIEQIARSARTPLVRYGYTTLVSLMRALSQQPPATDQQITHALLDHIAAIQQCNDLEIPHAYETLEAFQQLQQLLQARSIAEIEACQQTIRPHSFGGLRRFNHLTPIFERLSTIVLMLKRFRRREALGDRAASLIEAMTEIDEIRRDTWSYTDQDTARAMTPPEDQVLALLLLRWHAIIMKELRRLRGEAQLEPRLQNWSALPDSQINVVLSLKNLGNCLAENVHIQLDTSSDYEVINTPTRTYEIPALQQTTCDFVLRPCVEMPRLCFSMTFDDAERRQRHQPFADYLQLQRNQQPFIRIPNNYHSGVPVHNQEMFFGREEDLAFLRDHLRSEAKRIVLLIGQRRSGKTSLLYRLVDTPALLAPHVPLILDLQLLALTSDTAGFLHGLAGLIAETLERSGQPIAVPQETAFVSDPGAAFLEFLQAACAPLNGAKLILLFDELEVIKGKIAADQLKPAILPYLCSLMQHHPSLHFVLTGAPELQSQLDERWSSIFHLAQYHTLSRLSTEAANLLITVPVENLLRYDDLALEALHQLTGDEPNLIHLYCETLIRGANRAQRSYITITDVNAALHSVLEKGTNHFTWLWQQATPTERFILATLAQGQEAQLFIQDDIKAEYAAYELVYEADLVHQALQHLVSEDFIEERQHGTQFRIPVGLTRLWLRMEKPPDRVAREEHL